MIPIAWNAIGKKTKVSYIYGEYQVYWWLGDAKNANISRHGINLIILRYSVPCREGSCVSCHPPVDKRSKQGMLSSQPFLELSSWCPIITSSHCNPSDDWASVSTQTWVAVTCYAWDGTRIVAQQWSAGDPPHYTMLHTCSCFWLFSLAARLLTAVMALLTALG